MIDRMKIPGYREWRYGGHKPVPNAPQFTGVCVAEFVPGVKCLRSLNGTGEPYRHNPRPYGRAGSA